MTKKGPEPIKGVCYFHSETGTEGGHWAFQDERYIFGDGHWSYHGMYILRDGDHLTIHDPDKPDVVLWSGVISLKKYPPHNQDALGFWIHSDQGGVNRETWARWFMRECPATLIPVPRE